MFKQLLFVITTVVMVGGFLALADDDDNDHRSRKHMQRRAVDAPENANYKAECSSCHMAYPPGLLPARSWTKMMTGLNDHFGDNASLDKAASEVIVKFLTENSADHSTLRRSRKIAKSIPVDESPLRFTETQYFKRQHHEVGKGVWVRKAIGSPSNCSACHSRAEGGIFSEDEVKIPR